MAKVVKEVPISCRPGWTPDYELIASRIPTLILPSHAIASVGFISFVLHIHSTDCLHSLAQYHLNGPIVQFLGPPLLSLLLLVLQLGGKGSPGAATSTFSLAPCLSSIPT